MKATTLFSLSFTLLAVSLGACHYYDRSPSFQRERHNFFAHDAIKKYLTTQSSSMYNTRQRRGDEDDAVSKQQQQQQQQQYQAFIVGATGAVGKFLLTELLESGNCKKIVTLTRRPITSIDKKYENKLKQIVVSDPEKFFDQEYISSIVAPEIENFDVAFSSFGTTRRNAGGAKEFERIDRDMNIFYGHLVYNQSHIQFYSLVSSIGANKDSWFLYPRCKGEIEHALANMTQAPTTDKDNKPRHLAIFRPSVLIAHRETDFRPGEPTAQWLFQVLGKSLLVGPIREYRAIRVEDVAKAMRIEFESRWMQQKQEELKGISPKQQPTVAIYSSDKIQLIADHLEDTNH